MRNLLSLFIHPHSPCFNSAINQLSCQSSLLQHNILNYTLFTLTMDKIENSCKTKHYRRMARAISKVSERTSLQMAHTLDIENLKLKRLTEKTCGVLPSLKLNYLPNGQVAKKSPWSARGHDLNSDEKHHVISIFIRLWLPCQTPGVMRPGLWGLTWCRYTCWGLAWC